MTREESRTDKKSGIEVIRTIDVTVLQKLFEESGRHAAVCMASLKAVKTGARLNKQLI